MESVIYVIKNWIKFSFGFQILIVLLTFQQDFQWKFAKRCHSLLKLLLKPQKSNKWNLIIIIIIQKFSFCFLFLLKNINNSFWLFVRAFKDLKMQRFFLDHSRIEAWKYRLCWINCNYVFCRLELNPIKVFHFLIFELFVELN